MDGIGLSTIAFGALFFHFMRGEGPPPLMFAVLYTFLRFAYNDFALPEGYWKLYFVFLGVCVIGFLSAVAMHFASGEN